VTGPAVRMSTNRLREIAPLVREAGLKISHDLGFMGTATRPVTAARAAAQRGPKVRTVHPVSRARIAAK